MIRILCVGRMKSPHFLAAAEDYRTRLRRFARLDIVEVPDSDPENEGRKLESQLKSARVILCEAGGELWTSEDFAGWLGEHGSSDFLLGGPSGLSEGLRVRATKTLAFGRITLPHELARVVLLEQIYRGFSILRGHPYHR